MKKIFQYNVALLFLFVTFKAYSAPGTLVDLPPTIGVSVQPNVLFLLDDSGSMNWEILRSGEAEDIYEDVQYPGRILAADLDVCTGGLHNFDIPAAIRIINPLSNTSLDFSPSDDTFNLWVEIDDVFYRCPFTFDAPNQNIVGEIKMLNLCRGYNATAFDFRVAAEGGYTPWEVTEEFDTSFEPQELSNALGNPYQEWTRNLNNFFYFVWNGEDEGTRGDGVYQAGECPTDFASYDADDNGVISSAECTALGEGICRVASSLPDNYEYNNGSETVTINLQEQYANWYSYYRKREYVAKRAMSSIITNTPYRMGMATLHNNSLDGEGVAAIIKDMRSSTFKNELLDSLFRVDSSGGTPLRSRLYQVGRYYHQEGTADEIDDLFGSTPEHTDDTLNATTPIFDGDNNGQCQQNFAVVFSDGFWNGGISNSVGDTDGNTARDGEPDQTATAYDGGNFADSFSDTLADIAMKFLEEDLSPGTDGLANVLEVDDVHQENDADGNRIIIPHQHLTTYTVAFGVNGELDEGPSIGVESFDWPRPISNRLTTIDDMRHAAWNGRGEFLSAGNPQELISRLNRAITSIDARVGTAAAASFNANSISNDTRTYRSTFNTDDWSGDLEAFAVNDQGATGTAIWSADSQLANMTPLQRTVLTFNGVSGVPFTFPPVNDATGVIEYSDTTLSLTQVTDLLFNIGSQSVYDAQDFGERVVNYLRGDSTHEAIFTDTNGDDVDDVVDLFRYRNGKNLGPLIHSAPQFVGNPNDKYPDLIEGANNPYSAHRALTRTATVYIGGNDGMLHAFNASNGQELFAYMPGFLFETTGNVSSIASTTYTHNAYVDATPTIRDVFIDGSWRTYLVGGTRSGGRGIYVLDVTNPDSISNDTADDLVKFEFTHPDLGYTYSRPQIARTNDDRWVAIIANGYNAEGDGTAKLFIIDLDDGTAQILETSSNSLSAGVNCEDTSIDCNGLSTPTLADLNGDFLVDRVYAGDLHGNLWAFDLSSSTSSQWGVATTDSDSNTPLPLITVCNGACSETTRQPITTKPEIGFHPSRRSVSTSPNVLVYFGTGQLLTDNDIENSSLQSLYAVWDSGSSQLTRDDLQGRIFSYDTSTNSYSVRASNGANENLFVDYSNSNDSTSRGWYMDIATSGDVNLFNGGRVVVNPLLLNQVIFFVITVPSDNICRPESDSYLAALDSYDGSEVGFNVFDSNDDDSEPDNSGPILEQEVELVGLDSFGADKLATTDSDGGISLDTVATSETIAAGRKAWSILK